MNIYLHNLFVIINTKIDFFFLCVIWINICFFLFLSFTFIWAWSNIFVILRLIIWNFFTLLPKQFLLNMRGSCIIFRYRFFWWLFFLRGRRSNIFFYLNLFFWQRISLNMDCFLFWIQSLFHFFLSFFLLFDVSHFFGFFLFRYWWKFYIASRQRIFKFWGFLIICSIIFFFNFLLFFFLLFCI